MTTGDKIIVIKSANKLNHSILTANGIAIINQINEMIMVDFARDLCLIVINASTGPSKIPIDEEIAAKIILKKKIIAIIFPYGITLKIAGNVMKSNAGPDAGSNPKAKVAGTMINDASKAAIVSKIAI